jgi:hypothetical protein
MLTVIGGSEQSDTSTDDFEVNIPVIKLDFDLPTKVISIMRERHGKFDGAFTNKDTYREAFRDKLETTLTILSKK